MIKRILFAFALILSSNTVILADQSDDARIKKLALEAILENPQIIAEAITLLRNQDEQRKLEQMKLSLDLYRDELEMDPNAPILGNADGDVTVVEFFDYNCPYCKQVAPDVLELISTDEDVKVVYREWPILGEGSVFAARAALAARNQDKYEEMHWALMSLRTSNRDTVLQAAAELGMDLVQLQRDMKSPEIDQHIELSMQLANAIGFTGTPSFVIGSQAAPGAVPLATLREMVSDARKIDEGSSN